MAVTSDKKFEAAARDVQKLTKRPDDGDMLRLYALYKQGTEGDVKGDRPGALAMKDRAKFDAWTRVKARAAELGGLSTLTSTPGVGTTLEWRIPV